MVSKKKAFRRLGSVTIEYEHSKPDHCTAAYLAVNGEPANLWIFGRTKDLFAEMAPVGGCGDRTFVPLKSLSTEVMEKYHLNDQQDVDDLNELLRTEFSCGYCHRCR